MKRLRWLTAAGMVVLAGAVGATTVSAGMRAPHKKITIGFVVHVKGNPFIQQIIDGANAAGKDLGITVKVAGPAGGDPNEQLSLVQNLIASGAAGVATSVPGESMSKTLNGIIASGKGVVQFNLLSKSVRAPYVGERSTNSGRILGRLIARKLGGRNATGTVIIGNCFPGFPVLENRARGVKQGLKLAPGLKVLGPFDVKVDANDNYAHWQQLYAANPDARAMIGLCAPDVASLGKLNAANGNKIIAGGYDTTADNLAAIAAGHAYVTLGQNPFVQGYLPIKMIYDHVTKGTPLKAGFLESGTEVVTKAGATEPYGLGKLSLSQVIALSKSPAKTRAFYTPLVKGKLANWSKLIEPIANEGR